MTAVTTPMPKYLNMGTKPKRVQRRIFNRLDKQTFRQEELVKQPVHRQVESVQPMKALDQTFIELGACGGEKTKEERNVTGVERFRKKGDLR